MEQEWISVKDKLPPINGVSALVLVWDSARKTYFTAHRYPDSHRSKQYHWRVYDVDGSSMVKDEITHWMPLPKPPKS